MGSLAYKLEDGVHAVLTAGGLPQLLRQLNCEDERVVEAAVRCLHFLLQVRLHPNTYWAPPCKHPLCREEVIAWSQVGQLCGHDIF